ncbi:gephyrin-like molybdotransferase Glp [Actibacterium sp. 188UL27-1]|uniref:molybdopterin molybdotransferase MoeA n=1 Tax=Actibacterium sp. 188UL27-1 TaxID=2786961 RepID=UPI00195DC202|nr:gephyrin-like molybdotransferase Glp [Actibacterium sp. 188UL27-1]MBM7067651.1 molybdopterin molybdotransferase MoeA [Actibacterium sp. 188UL27-1]
MISVDDALHHVFDLLSPVGTETVPLSQAAGRVLAEPVIAGRDQPPFPSSAMDGYAVRTDDAQPGATLTVIGEAAAGARFHAPVAPNQAVRIFTGAPVPEGATRIVIQEDVVRNGDTITLNPDLDNAAYIRPQGTDFPNGLTLPEGRRLGPNDLALAAAMNCPHVTVRRRPVVALLATGDELAMPGDDPGPDQIIASNIFALKAILQAEGAAVRLLPIARDRTDSLRAGFERARGTDLLVTTGGASVGDHDLVGQVAAELGMARAFYRVAMRPGKPLMAGRVLGRPMVGLPGNPVSAIVCGHIFLRPVIRVLLGLAAAPLTRQRATLAAPLPQNGPREHYMRAYLTDGQVRAHDRQDSSLLSVLGLSNALLVRAPHAPACDVGTTVPVIPL